MGKMGKNKKRQAVYDKYQGLCAYTGKPLGDDWQIDHMEPHFYGRMYSRDPNRPENLVPALRIVNHYKRCLHLEGFRAYMLTFHNRLKKLPKEPKVEKSANRKAYMLKVAEAFGITPDNPFNGVFYFESFNPTTNAE
jgi:5-methylcytosine-specific restriction endonuclease McrA